jgi:hypothetical protein
MRICRRMSDSVSSRGSLGLLAALLMAGYGVATSTAQENGVITVCVGRSGDMRVVDNAEACRKDERVAWGSPAPPSKFRD